MTFAHHMIDGDITIEDDHTKIVDSIINGSVTVKARDCVLSKSSIFGDVLAQPDTQIEDCRVDGKIERL